jgi:hypothetical protein
VLPPLKKGAGLALTSPVTLRHNHLVRECVHGERVLAQPMTPECDLKISFCNVTYATIDSSGIDAIRGLFGPRVAFFVCLPKDMNWVKHGSPPADIGAN